MNKITQNGHTINQEDNYIEVDGVRTELPDYVKSKSNYLVVVNGLIKINGYIFNPKNKTFKKEKLDFVMRFLNWLK